MNQLHISKYKGSVKACFDKRRAIASQPRLSKQALRLRSGQALTLQSKQKNYGFWVIFILASNLNKYKIIPSFMNGLSASLVDNNNGRIIMQTKLIVAFEKL